MNARVTIADATPASTGRAGARPIAILLLTSP